ncbi:MAG: hypothetical protein ACE5I5_08415 [Candidatus Heimdallarchaeota archaeon]
MSRQSGNGVMDVNDANKIARETMDTAGYFFYFIRETRKEGSTWLVLVSVIHELFKITIDAATGEVLEFRRTEGNRNM